jgi:hypothetical protein
MRKHRQISLCLGALISLGCGGNAVDLGHGQGGQGWVDAPDREASSSTPQTIYESDEQILGFALDGGTLYALVDRHPSFELISCPLELCRSQRTTLFSGPKPSADLPRMITLVAAGGRLFWSFHDADLVACAATGCSDLQRVSSALAGGCLTTDGDALYWIDRERTLQRLSLNSDAPEDVRELASQIAGPERLVASGDYLYLSDAEADLHKIRRVRKDGTTDAELVVEDDAISGLSAVGDAIYYPSKILSGRVVKCAPNDCTKASITLAHDQRWPSEIHVEGDEAFWLTDTRFSYYPSHSSLASCRLPDCASVQIRAGDFPRQGITEFGYRATGFAVDARSLVWLEGRGEQPGARLRRLAR